MSAIARTAAQLNLNPTLTALITRKDVRGLQKQGLSRADAKALARGDPRALQTLAKKNPKLLQALKAKAEVPAGPTGIVVNQEKKTISGSAMPTMADGQRMVDIPGLGQLPAPEPGKLSSFLVSEDKLMSMKADANGMVTMSTRTLELKAKGSGFKGDVLPDPTTGKVNIGGKELDVSGLKPGKTKKVKVKINGKKYKVKLRLNEDGSVNVQGKRSRGLFGSILHGLGKAISFAGKFAPLLMAIPGAGLAAAIGKGLSIASSAKGVIDSVRTGNWLGAIGSLAGGVANFGRGAFAAAANTVSKVAHFGQDVLNTFKYGLGKGVLPIIANGANLLSGAAGLFGKNNLANTVGQVSSYASVADAALKGNFGPALQKLVNELGPDVIQHLKEQQRKGVEYSIYKGVQLKPFDFQHLPDIDWSKAEFVNPDAPLNASSGDRRPSYDPRTTYATNGLFYADSGDASGASNKGGGKSNTARATVRVGDVQITVSRLNMGTVSQQNLARASAEKAADDQRAYADDLRKAGYSSLEQWSRQTKYYGSDSHKAWAQAAEARTGGAIKADFWMRFDPFGGTAGNGPNILPQGQWPGFLSKISMAHDTDWSLGRYFGVGPLAPLRGLNRDPDTLGKVGLDDVRGVNVDLYTYGHPDWNVRRVR